MRPHNNPKYQYNNPNKQYQKLNIKKRRYNIFKTDEAVENPIIYKKSLCAFRVFFIFGFAGFILSFIGIFINTLANFPLFWILISLSFGIIFMLIGLAIKSALCSCPRCKLGEDIGLTRGGWYQPGHPEFILKKI